MESGMQTRWGARRKLSAFFTREGRYFDAMKIQGLRSPHEKTGGIVYFGRMLDKIRLHAAGSLPGDYIPNLGGGFDERCVKFLWVDYPALVERVKQGGDDDEILEWCFGQGRRPSEEEIEVWNDFMSKRGWNDEAGARLRQRKAEGGFEKREDIQTFFDYIDLDEGRDPAA
jgi:gluconokinase